MVISYFVRVVSYLQCKVLLSWWIKDSEIEEGKEGKNESEGSKDD